MGLAGCCRVGTMESSQEGYTSRGKTCVCEIGGFWTSFADSKLGLDEVCPFVGSFAG